MPGLNLQSQVRGDKLTHLHRWRLRMHMDGCHWYASVFECADCTATVGTYDERDLSEDPYSAMWMDDPEYRDPEAEPCKRCAELRDGAQADHKTDYTPAR